MARHVLLPAKTSILQATNEELWDVKKISHGEIDRPRSRHETKRKKEKNVNFLAIERSAHGALSIAWSEAESPPVPRGDFM